MQSRVIVNGARGKMGALACATIDKHPHFKLVGALSREDDLKDAIRKTEAEIVIDLTRADCVYQNCLSIIGCGAHPVIGTSGLLAEEITHLQGLCAEKKIRRCYCPQFFHRCCFNDAICSNGCSLFARG